MEDDAKLLSRHNFLEKYGGHSEWFYDKIHGELIREILADSLKSIEQRELNQMRRITVKEWKTMGKVKAWLMDMEEDATHLSLNEWTAKHGSYRKEIWDRVQTEREEDQLTMELPNE